MRQILLGSLILIMIVDAQAQQKPSPLKTDNLTYQDRKKWRNALKWSDECEESFNDNEGTKSGLRVWNLAERKYLVEVQCTVTYQGVLTYFLYDAASPSVSRLLKFTVYKQNEAGRIIPQEETQLAGYPDFDTKTTMLKVWTKFRGDSDCGSMATYKIIPTGSVELKDFRAKYNCDGQATLPENYPHIFP